MLVAKAGDLVGDDRGPVAVDLPGGQRGHRGGQAAQRGREIKQDIRCPCRQRQRGGDLIADVLPTIQCFDTNNEA
jgi:hypothetical protein